MRIKRLCRFELRPSRNLISVSALPVLLGILAGVLSACGAGSAETTPSPTEAVKNAAATPLTGSASAPVTPPPAPPASAPASAASSPIPAPVSAQLRTVTYEASDENFPNPERGALIGYQPIGSNGTVLNRDPLSNDGVMGYFKRERDRTGATTIRIVYSLAEWKTSNIPTAFLDRLQVDFDAARNNGFKLIPYFTYAWVLDQAETAARDASADQTVRHIEQLAPLLARNQDVLAMMIAGFIGAWGEWHDSSNGNISANNDVNDNTRRIYAALMKAVPAQRSVLLRFATAKRQLLGDAAISDAEAFAGSDRARTGFHDEGFLQNKFGSDVFFDWYDAYVRAEGRYTPSIELFDSGLIKDGTFVSCASVYKELARRGSDLMADTSTDQPRIEQGCEPEVRKRLGYRYRLTEASFPQFARAGESMAYSIKLNNDGWSSVFNARPTQLVLRSQATGKTLAIALQTDARRWAAGEQTILNGSVTLPAGLPAGAYDLLLHMPDADAALSARPEYAVRLANKNLWEPATGFNNLLQTLQINP